ncbi:MAG: recombinase family protein [bacterium]
MENEPIQKAIICTRVSSEKQIQEGNGLTSQEFRCRQYARMKNYKVIAIYKDEGESGAIFERTSIKQTIKHLEKDINNDYIVIFDDIKRIARSVQVHWAIKECFNALGAKIESPNFRFEDTPEGEFVETVMAGTAQLERQQNARQVKQKMMARIELGYWCLTEPFGIRYEKTTEGKILTYNATTKNIIKNAINGFAENRFITQTNVLNYLEDNKQYLGKIKIDIQLVKRILTEILYTGYLEYPKWEIKRQKGKHESIISLEAYEKVQDKLQSSQRLISKWEINNPKFPLRKIVNCAMCGKKMTGSKVKGKIKYYSMYTCNNKLCKSKPKNIQKHILEKEYIKLLDSISPSKEILELTKAISLNTWKTLTKKRTLEANNNKRIIKEKEKKIDIYLDLIPSAKSSLIVDKYNEKIESEIEVLKKINKTNPDIDFDKALNKVLNFIGTPSKYWKETDFEGKHLIHNLLFTQNPSFDLQNGFRTPSFSIFTDIKKETSNKKSSMVDPRRIELLTSTVSR